MTVFLSIEDLLDIAEIALAGREMEVRDHGLLEAAAARPAATVFGEDAYPSIFMKAAALLHSLATNHGLVDGNKRLALEGVYTFLGLNGWVFDAPDDEAFELVVAVADGGVSDVEKIAARLERWCERE